MKIYMLASFLVLLLGSWSCDKNQNSQLNCHQFQLNKPFTAKVNEEWCLQGSEWKIKFGPFIEDSRCNVPGIECFWAGRYVMGATIENGETVRDTFEAVYNWTDTLHQGYQIILAKVYPEIRTSMEPLDTSKYSFDIIIK